MFMWCVLCFVVSRAKVGWWWVTVSRIGSTLEIHMLKASLTAPARVKAADDDWLTKTTRSIPRKTGRIIILKRPFDTLYSHGYLMSLIRY